MSEKIKNMSILRYFKIAYLKIIHVMGSTHYIMFPFMKHNHFESNISENETDVNSDR